MLQGTTELYEVHNTIDIIRLKPVFFSETSAKTILLTSNCEPEKLFEWFKDAFTCIEAAGGLVENGEGEYLFIFRRGKWDLPKGKIDPGETHEEAALREVEEETGIRPDYIRRYLQHTWHFYAYKGEIVLKCNTWYLMEVKGKPEGTPQKEEDIEMIRWFHPTAMNEVLRNCHPSLVALFMQKK